MSAIFAAAPLFRLIQFLHDVSVWAIDGRRPPGRWCIHSVPPVDDAGRPGVGNRTVRRPPPLPGSGRRPRGRRPDAVQLRVARRCSAAARPRSSSRNFGQRVRNRQPDGRSIGLGRSPVSRIRSALRSFSGSGIGIADSSACVYGCVGVSNTESTVADLDDPAEVHHRDPVGDVAHDGEVVGDEQVRQARARRCSSSSRLMTPAWIDTSSADTGSSSTISFGSSASARAMPMRWRWPPEKCCG